MHTLCAPRIASPDPRRIAALSGALLFNGLILALVAVPMAPMMLPATPDTDVVYVPPRREPPPPPPPADPVPVEIRNAPVPPVARPAPAVRPDSPPQPLTDTAGPQDYAVADVPEEAGPAIADIAEPGPPLAGAHLAYESNPAPPYPLESLRNQESGTVLLEVLVDVDGRPLEVRVSRSSGHRALDAAARRQVLAKWRFRPAMQDGRAVQAIGLVPVDFSLN
ncbi:MAG TPA: TonB family protein [Lysobacter sp.]